MNDQRYPLQQLADIKKKRLEEAERILREKKELLEKEEEKLRAVQKERDEVLEHKQEKLTQLREELDKGSTSDKIQQMKQYLKVVDEDLALKERKVQDQQKQVDKAAEEVEKARQNYVQKERDVEKIAMHRKEWGKEVRLEELRQEGITTDELGSAMFTLRKQERERRERHRKEPKKKR